MGIFTYFGLAGLLGSIIAWRHDGPGRKGKPQSPSTAWRPERKPLYHEDGKTPEESLGMGALLSYMRDILSRQGASVSDVKDTDILFDDETAPDYLRNGLLVTMSHAVTRYVWVDCLWVPDIPEAGLRIPVLSVKRYKRLRRFTESRVFVAAGTGTPWEPDLYLIPVEKIPASGIMTPEEVQPMRVESPDSECPGILLARD